MMKRRMGRYGIVAAIAAGLLLGGWSVSQEHSKDTEPLELLLSAINPVLTGEPEAVANYGTELGAVGAGEALRKTAGDVAAALGTGFAAVEGGYRGIFEGVDGVKGRWIVTTLHGSDSAYLSLRLEADSGIGISSLAEKQEAWTASLKLNPDHWRIAVQGTVAPDRYEHWEEEVLQALEAKERSVYRDERTVVKSLISKKLPDVLNAGMNAQIAVRHLTTDGSYRLTIGTPVITTEYL